MELSTSNARLVRRPSRERLYQSEEDAAAQSVLSADLGGPENNYSSSALAYSSYTSAENRITLTWSHLSVDVPLLQPSADEGDQASSFLSKIPFFRRGAQNPRKVILRNSYGIAKPGSILAIIGSSGCGKSTLLNMLMGRIPRSFNVKGKVQANGATIGKAIAKITAYLQQDDIFTPNMTVGEHLWFHSKLRLSSERYSDKDRREKINTVLHELSLRECSDVLIGGGQFDGGLAKKTLSGGERKRLAFATEILTNPSVLCCDEPTTGLDSFMAETIVQSMKQLAERGKTVICTLHQPSSQIISLLDQVLVMHEGCVIFLGEAKFLTDYFTSIGHECPDAYNPFDHVISVLSSPTITFERYHHRDMYSSIEQIHLANKQAGEDASIAKAEALAEIFKHDRLWKTVRDEIRVSKKRRGAAALLEQKLEASEEPASFWCQLKMCTWRSWLTTIRSKKTFVARIFTTLFLSALYSLVFANQSYNQKGAMNFVGLLYQIATMAFWENMEPYAMSIPHETPIFLREQQSSIYSPAAYFLGRIVVETPQLCTLSVLFMTIVYFSTNMLRTASHFFYAVIIHASSAWCASGLGYLIGFGIDHPGISNGVRRAMGPVLSMTAGLYVNLSTMPAWLSWLRYVSPKFFANELFQINQWIDVENLECESSFSTACFEDGRSLLQFYGFSPDNVTRNILAIVAWMIAYRLAAFLVLLYRTNRRKNDA